MYAFKTLTHKVGMHHPITIEIILASIVASFIEDYIASLFGYFVFSLSFATIAFITLFAAIEIILALFVLELLLHFKRRIKVYRGLLP